MAPETKVSSIRMNEKSQEAFKVCMDMRGLSQAQLMQDMLEVYLRPIYERYVKNDAMVKFVKGESKGEQMNAIQMFLNKCAIERKMFEGK